MNYEPFALSPHCVRIVVAPPFQRMNRSRMAKTNAKNKTFPGI
jgi:hypothetical protein